MLIVSRIQQPYATTTATTTKTTICNHHPHVQPTIQVRYWSSYSQQLGIEWICGSGYISSHFNLNIIKHNSNLKRRPMTQWTVKGTTCSLNDTKVTAATSGH